MITANNSLKTDLYELTMAAGYFQNKMEGIATFELSCHTMPPNRSYLVVCGLEQIIDYILHLKFSEEEINFIKSLSVFKKVNPAFFDYLKNFKFTGDLWAMPEGEIFFAGEPVIQVVAPIIEAQILETYLLSILNIESLVATKASRVVHAACIDGQKRAVIDFGSRRAHGPEAGILAARAAYLAGCAGTSNVYAGKKFGIPLYGTVAHSWVEAFESEEKSFYSYYCVFPDNTILLIDTYDALKAVKKLTELDFKEKIKAIRIDSGDLKILSQKIRKILDANHLEHVKIIGSGNLNEYKIQELIQNGSRIDLFGVGTDMVTSRDYPALDLTYKLVQMNDSQKGIQYKFKRSQGKKTIPGRKQIFRIFDKKGIINKDIIGLFSEKPPKGSQNLLHPMIEKGQLKQPLPSLEDIRSSSREKLAALPKRYFDLKKIFSIKREYSKALSKVCRLA